MVVMGNAKRISAAQPVRQSPVYDSYGRLSRVPETGELEKIDTQHADNRQVIDRLGGTLGEELSDGLSAWKRGVRRPGWETLLERVKAGESDGIVVWHTDRLFRQPRDLEALIDLADKGFTVASAHGKKDLSNPDDRFILRIEVAHAARSSDDTQRRIKRRFETLRGQGVLHDQGRAFGFPGMDYTISNKANRKPVAAELVERERAALRDGTRARLAGLSQTVIAHDWNTAGLKTVTGKAWTPAAVRDVLDRPRNAGLIEHDGQIVGRIEGDPIVPVADFERLQAIRAGRKRGRAPGAVYVASGIARCELCQHPLSGRPHTGLYPDGEKRRQYACVKARGGCGKVAADVRAVDREIRGFVINRLSDRKHASALTAARARVADRLAEVEQEISECERIQQALSDRLGRRQLTLDAFDAANEPLVADLARLSAERDTLTGGESGGPVVAMSAAEVAAEWDAAEVPERRVMLRSALGRERLAIAAAAGRGRGKFDTSRVRLPDTTTADG